MMPSKYSHLSVIFVVSFLVSVFLPNTLFAGHAVVLEGRIMDINDSPVQGAEVYAYNSPKVKRPADFISKKTGADGGFRLILPPGKYWAVAIYRKSGERFGPLGMGDKHSGEPIELDFKDREERVMDFVVLDLREAARRLSKKSADTVKISGRIIDARGKPVQTAYAVADNKQNSEDMPEYISAWTDDMGRYILYLPRGRFYVGAAGEFPPAHGFSLSREFIFEDDVSNLDIILE